MNSEVLLRMASETGIHNPRYSWLRRVDAMHRERNFNIRSVIVSAHDHNIDVLHTGLDKKIFIASISDQDLCSTPLRSYQPILSRLERDGRNLLADIQ